MEELKQFLQENKIEYQICSYDPNVKSTTLAADQMNLKVNQIVKSLLVLKKNKYYLLLLSSDNKVSNNQYKMADKDKIKEITGYELGSVTPFFLKSNIDIILDEKVQKLDKVSIASGTRGYDILLSPQDLIKLVNARIEKLT